MATPAALLELGGLLNIYRGRFLRASGLLCLLFLALGALGQMTTGSAMEDFAKTFNLSATGWSVRQIGCSRGANVLWPGEDVTFTFFAKPAQPYKGRVKVDVIRYGIMPRFCAYFDTDYEFALSRVGEQYGGGTEIFCLQRPGMMRKHFFPRQPRAAVDGGPSRFHRVHPMLSRVPDMRSSLRAKVCLYLLDTGAAKSRKSPGTS